MSQLYSGIKSLGYIKEGPNVLRTSFLFVSVHDHQDSDKDVDRIEVKSDTMVDRIVVHLSFSGHHCSLGPIEDKSSGKGKSTIKPDVV